jgi:hypothetical protein
MGQTMGQRLTNSHWPEAIARILIPPACREEVLGDLHERNASCRQYVADAIRTVPLVIWSRIRRTSDGRLLALYAIALYFAFWSAAWYSARPFLQERWGLLLLAVPCAVALMALVLEEAYANPARRSAFWWLRGPMFAIAAAFVSQAALWAAGSSLALPFAIAYRGAASGLVWTLIIRSAFQSLSSSRRGPI